MPSNTFTLDKNQGRFPHYIAGEELRELFMLKDMLNMLKDNVKKTHQTHSCINICHEKAPEYLNLVVNPPQLLLY